MYLLGLTDSDLEDWKYVMLLGCCSIMNWLIVFFDCF